MKRKSLRERIDKVRNQYITQAEKQVGKIIAKEFGVKSIVISEYHSQFAPANAFNVNIDGYKITGIEIDDANNVSLARVDLMSIEYLEKVRLLFNEYLENVNSYHHRTGTAFFIEYFRRHYKKLTKDVVQKMCDIDDVDNEGESEGFREWLVGDSYCTGGNLCDYETKWKKEDFIRK